MAEMILHEKYTTKLVKEKALYIARGTNGGLSLVDIDFNIYLVFDPTNTFLSTYSNLGSTIIKNKNGNSLILNLSNIHNIEIGRFKDLWVFIYTLRIYEKNGNNYNFMMPSRERALEWVNVIKKYL